LSEGLVGQGIGGELEAVDGDIRTPLPEPELSGEEVVPPRRRLGVEALKQRVGAVELAEGDRGADETDLGTLSAQATGDRALEDPPRRVGVTRLELKLTEHHERVVLARAQGQDPRQYSLGALEAVGVTIDVGEQYHGWQRDVPHAGPGQVLSAPRRLFDPPLIEGEPHKLQAHRLGVRVEGKRRREQRLCFGEAALQTVEPAAEKEGGPLRRELAQDELGLIREAVGQERLEEQKPVALEVRRQP
jgi:hypothetical protein